jgi:hypothetical protein
VHDSEDMLSRAAKVVIKYLVREEIEKWSIWITKLLVQSGGHLMFVHDLC